MLGEAPALVILQLVNEMLDWIIKRPESNHTFDMRESFAVAAVRETYEETGYPCTLLPLNMITRAPESGMDMKDAPRRVERCTEPFRVTMRHVSERDIKFIWWFVTIVQQGEAKRDSTQMLSENFESVLFNVDDHARDVDDLLQVASRLTFADDQDVVKAAIRLVYATYPEWFSLSASCDINSQHGAIA